MKKITDALLLVCFAGFLAAVPLLGAAVPDELITFTENRELQQAPVLQDWKFSQYMKDWDAYAVDQLPFRETLLAAYTRLQLASGKYMVRNLYVVDQEWLLPREYERESWQLKRYTDAIAQTVQDHPQTQFAYLMVPFKTGALYRLAPTYIDNQYAADNHQQVIARLRRVDGLLLADAVDYFAQQCTVDELKTMYYKTDYHWNAVGARTAMKLLQQTFLDAGILDGRQLVTDADIELRPLDRSYQGDLNRQLSYLVQAKEQISVLELRDSAHVQYYQSVDDSQPVQRGEIIGAAAGQQEVSYNNVYTENLGYYRAVNPHARADKRVLIFKDSFQNPTADFFTAQFSEIDVIDPRYYQEPYTFEELLDRTQPDIVLFFYHQSNFSAELIRFLCPQTVDTPQK